VAEDSQAVMQEGGLWRSARPGSAQAKTPDGETSTAASTAVTPVLAIRTAAEAVGGDNKFSRVDIHHL